MSRFIIIFLTAVSVMSPLAASAAIVHVPADQPTIQAGVTAASPSDTVLVDHGVYYENVVIRAKQIVLASQYILDGDESHIAQTIINGSQPSHPDTGSCVIIHNGGSTRLIGFTITGGNGTIWFDPSDSRLYREGGGVLTDGGTPFVLHNLIIANEAVDRTGATSAGGGGIRSGFGTLATISHNVIAYNRAQYGGAVVGFHNRVELRNNVIYRNVGGADHGGGGLWLTSISGTSYVENNTIVENASITDGGGVLIWGAAVTLRNNIIRANTAVTAGPQIRHRAGGSGAVVYNNVEGGWAGTGNIDVDPMYATPEYLLDPASPCVDAGDPGASFNDVEDAGNPGQALPPSLGTVRNDMGAYGGPDASGFPIFNSTSVETEVGTLDFDSVSVATTGYRWLRLIKHGFGVVFVSKAKFYGSNADDLSVASTMSLTIGPAEADSLDSIEIAWTPSTFGMLDDTVQLTHSAILTTSPLAVLLNGTAPGSIGDVNLDGVITSADVIYLVNFVFKSGPAPKPVNSVADVSCDGNVSSADILFLVNHIFKGGAPPPTSCA